MTCFLKPPGPAVSPVQTGWHVTVPALHMRMRPQFEIPPAPALANSKLAPSCSATNAGAIVLIGIATDISTVVNRSCTAYLTDYYGNTTSMGQRAALWPRRRECLSLPSPTPQVRKLAHVAPMAPSLPPAAPGKSRAQPIHLKRARIYSHRCYAQQEMNS